MSWNLGDLQAPPGSWEPLLFISLCFTILLDLVISSKEHPGKIKPQKPSRPDPENGARARDHLVYLFQLTSPNIFYSIKPQALTLTVIYT